MRRIAEEQLKNWYRKKNRMPLILRGARQVGKSTLVRIFCKSQNLDLIEVNLEKEKLRSVNGDRINLGQILDEIQLRYRKRVTKETIIFFDEIQDQPILLKYLRYFYEERPELAIIAAGSLLELSLYPENFSFPVGRVEFYHLGPMTFIEFLWATDQSYLAEKIINKDFAPSVIQLAKENLRNYLYVGGMPKAVSVFAEEKSLVNVRYIQDQIIQTYMADFPKYNSKINVERIHRIFAAVSLELGKKVIYKRLDPESQSRDRKRIVELLIQARVLLPCIHTSANSVPLAGESDPSILKLYFVDIGLVNAMMRLDLDIIDQEMKNNFNTKGIIAEQFVAQHLAYVAECFAGPSLYYWLRDKGVQKGEIDFILSKGQNIIPIEVKASKAGHLKSLFYFAKEKKALRAIKISLDDFKIEQVKHKIYNEYVRFDLTNIPLYAVEILRKLI
jgi:uncharacterized protein